ncbi:nucleoid-associated protein [Sphingorhabdus contaminans]|uniref:nucleoid-associated protein n=1 Tax=Sphingorhabdus contaminans TaxID=1343899 RepID=UPI003D27A594
MAVSDFNAWGRSMDLQNLVINRIILHEVFKKKDDGQAVAPAYGSQILTLNADAMGELRTRIVAATGSQSQSMEMTIARSDAGSCVKLAEDLLDAASDAEFVQASRRAADMLTGAQDRRPPGGVLAVFSGMCGVPARPIVGLIKAELHGGFRRAANLSVEYIKSLFMTPQTKLYKIGLFKRSGGPGQPLPNGWTAAVYDSLMSTSNPDNAAFYFYSSFLGLQLPDSAPRMTRRFYEGTKEFIKSANIPEEQKVDLLTSLYSYLKVDTSATIQTAIFASQNLGPELQDPYADFMTAKGFPTTAISKDISQLNLRLEKRRIEFSRQVKLTGPSQAFEDLVTIETINQDDRPPLSGPY